ncbi:DEAD/DEAH box helicase family protein [Tenacibaculum tangerinum]|uniref:DEAD/DEAH box helicase family protein n=1 Tax=Tenacibaculum tangerinum TaxID=3038772 RepID=A0ABY8L564_9FLAO|nr:DEAD/DEAH box helicase family protein [Tenacibaculum tangerinum]WGH76416.1 DEAD/DEAH box helicase family protein [Tenacibaculum tangerinum]
MSITIANLDFLFDWRPYQAKVLENFSIHINDNHFHIVAPPGSGKTILGIEIVKRIGKKTLVLAPTLTIRNQWEDRLQNFFTTDCNFTQISFDIKHPSDITFSTYQALHSFYKSFETKEAYYNFFKKHQIEVLLLDEAHHLKNAWWKCLFDLKEQHLQTVVALTATPPYDSENAEIQKYFKLCGEIDDEIVVPDLVKEHNLCPHQDVVFLSKPEDQEINFITHFRLKIAEFVADILNDTEFISFLKQHRFYAKTEENLEEIYKDTDFFSSLLIFLHEAKETIPFEKLEVLGFDTNETIEFPSITNEWIQILFQYLLVTDRNNLIEHEAYLDILEKRLRKLAVFSKNKVNLVGNDLLYKSLSNSPSKLKSITTIVQQEQHNLQDDLRCVILSDYIRKEYLNCSHSEIKEIKKLGVVPIFHHVRTALKNKNNVAVLTGSLVIIHSSTIAKLGLIDAIDNYNYTPLKSDTEFVILSNTNAAKRTIVETITQLFELGHIKVLVGTQSLLGEGWDAPSINSLILASVVGSFVTSNQMRGRAIRVDRKNPNKVGLIWHLACIDTSDESGGRDFEILARRFNAFLGISNDDEAIISNGIERLHLPSNFIDEDIQQQNNKTLELSKNRNLIAQRWKSAISNGKGIVKELTFYTKRNKQFPKQKRVYYQDIVKYTIGEIIIGLSFFIPEFIIRNLNILLHKGVVYFLFALLSTLGLTFGYKIYKSAQLYAYFGLIHKKIDKMATAVLKSLYTLNHVNTPLNEIKIETNLLAMGNVSCTIHGANRYESSLFIKALNELLQPIDNPKYLLIKSNWFRRKLKLHHFFPVPEIFGVRKKECQVFHSNWNKYLGSSKLVYTRTIEGRKLLLKARLFHIHNVNNKLTKKNIIWK